MSGLKNQHKFLWISTAVLFVAAVMRLFMLHDLPPGLARDEVRNADIVSFIRQGEHALFFGTGYGHEPLYHYFTVPFQTLLGDNMLSIRLPSVFLGMLLVAATMRWAKRDFGLVTAVITGLGLAVGWQAVIFSRIGIRPIMEPLLLVGAAWFWQKRPVVAGIFLGLSVYTYTGARVIFALPILYGFLQAINGKLANPKGQSFNLWQHVKPSLIIFVITVLIYLPLHFTLQADPSLQARISELQGTLDALFAGDLQPITTMTLRTLGVISFTGPPRWTYSIRGVSLFNWVTAVFFYAGFIMTLWRIRRAHYSFILAWLMVGILPSAITTHAPSIIRMIGAAPIFYLMPGIAIAVISKRIDDKSKWQYSYLLLLIPYLLFLSFHTISNGFVAWPNSEITREKYQTILLEMGRHWEANAKGNMVVMQNFYEPIEADTMRRNMGYDVSSRWAQTGPNIAGALVLPHAGYLYVPEYASPPLDLILAAGVDPQPLYRSEKLPSFAVYALDQSINIPVLIQPVQFDNKISLLGYGIGKQTDTQYQLFTYWRVESPLPEDLATFLHLIDADGNLFSQHDGLDVAAATLSPQDIIVQHHLIPLSAPLPTRYSLQIGLYTRTNNVRLLHDGQSADRFILQELP